VDFLKIFFEKVISKGSLCYGVIVEVAATLRAGF